MSSSVSWWSGLSSSDRILVFSGDMAPDSRRKLAGASRKKAQRPMTSLFTDPFSFPFPLSLGFLVNIFNFSGFSEREEREECGALCFELEVWGFANCRGVSASFFLSYRWWCNPRTPRGWILCSITILPILFLVNYECENLNHVQSKRYSADCFSVDNWKPKF